MALYTHRWIIDPLPAENGGDGGNRKRVLYPVTYMTRMLYLIWWNARSNQRQGDDKNDRDDDNDDNDDDNSGNNNDNDTSPDECEHAVEDVLLSKNGEVCDTATR